MERGHDLYADDGFGRGRGVAPEFHGLGPGDSGVRGLMTAQPQVGNIGGAARHLMRLREGDGPVRVRFLQRGKPAREETYDSLDAAQSAADEWADSNWIACNRFTFRRT